MKDLNKDRSISSYHYRWSKKFQRWVHLRDLPIEEQEPENKEFKAYPWENS